MRAATPQVDEMALLIYAPNGSSVVAPDHGAVEEHAAISVKTGVTYGILVMFYGVDAGAGALEFSVKADIRVN